MVSKIENERKAILEQLNKAGRRLEKQSPSDALELNVELRKVVEWLTARLRQEAARSPRGRRP
jgi:hypothetical protein